MIKLAIVAALIPVSLFAAAPISDDFHSISLNTGRWTFINPLADGAVAVTGSNLRLTVPGGANHDPFFGSANNSVRVVQNVTNTDFQVEVKFDSLLTGKYQMQGILVEQDATNYMRFEFASDGISTYLSANKIVNSVQTGLLSTQVAVSGASLWLRVQKSGNTWTETWSPNGTTFNNGVTFTQALTVARVGPYAGNFGSPVSTSPAFTSSVDYFFNTASPISPEDAGGPGISLVTVTPSVTSATFAWTSDVASSSRVDYGTTSSYGANVSDGTLVTSHSVTVPGLTCATPYNFQATSTTASGSTVSPNGTYTTTACGSAPDLTISKSHSGNFIQGGSGSYILTATNSGGIATSGTITVTDTLPSGLTASAINGTGWSCTLGTVSCTRSDALNPSASYPAITLTVNVAANAPSSVNNIATVAGGGQSNTSNDSASDPTTITPAGAGPISDDFHSISLNTGRWTFINPLADGAVAVTGSNLRLTVPGGANHDPFFGSANNSVRVVQNVTNTDFQVEVKFDSLLTGKYQMQGILVEQDATNYMRFEFASDGISTYLSANKIVNSVQTGLLSTQVAVSGASLWLRVQKSGNTWTETWSPNGTTFNNGVTFTQALTVARVGPYAGNFGSPVSTSPAFTSSVDYFFNTASPISPEDAGGPGISLVTVTPSVTSATFAWTSDVASSSRVDYGTTSSYGANVSDGTLVTSHSVTVPGLTCATPYNFQATSTTASGSTVSPNGTYTTTACGSAPDLTISKSHSGNFIQGGSGSYILTATNSGGIATSGTITVTDTLPSGLTASAINGTGWSCTLGTVSCTRSDALNPSASYPAITLTVNVAANAPSSVNNIATVAGGGQSNTSNDSASDPTTITPAGAGPISDDFHSISLNTGRWTFINPLADGAVAVTGSNLRLTVPGGANHDPFFGSANNSVRVVQNVTNTDFQVEVKFDSLLTGKYQMQGILVEQDATNYMRFEFASDGISTYLSANKIVNSVQTGLLSTQVAVSGASLWLRVQKSGNTWTETWSPNGTTFNNGVTFTQALTVARVGPYAGNFGSPVSTSPAFTSSVDYFFNTASPISPEDAGGPGISLVTVTPSVTSATFAWTSDVASSSRVDYGTTSSYGANVSDGTLVTSHSVTVPGLTCATSYNFQASSIVAGANTASPNGTFTTSACGSAPDLTLTKTHSGSFPIGGSGVYSLVVNNVGAAATSGTVTVTDSLPSGLTATAISGTGWTCSTPPTLSCTRTTALNPASSYPAIALTVSVASNAPSSVTNTAAVSGGGEINTSNDTASDPTSVGTASSNPASDDFHGATLDENLWTFIDPLGLSYSMSGTNLLLNLQGGVSHDPVANGANYSTRVMQSMQNVNFDLEVKFDSVPTQVGTSEGILIQQDSANFLRFEFQGNGGGTTLFAGKVIGNGATGLYNNSIGVTGSSLWMRVSRSGNTWTVTWSPNGTTFSSGTSFTQTLTVSAIGPMVGNYGATGPTTPDFSASVDYFFNLASPIIPQDGGEPRISSVNATPGAQSGAITWVTDESSNSRVDYGPSMSYGATVTDASVVSAHSLLVKGLACSTTYNYAVTSTDASSSSRQSPNSTFTTPPCASLTAPASDSFDTISPDMSRWTWIDPKGDSFLKFNGTTAQITVAAESLHNPWSFSGNASARIVQSIADNNFDVVAKFVSNLNSASTGQGIVVEQDALNYLLFELRTDGTTTTVWAGSRNGAATSILFNTSFHAYAPYWLQVVRSGTTWTVSWSANGNGFTQAGTFQKSLTVTTLGVYATNNGPTLLRTPAFTASVDAFMNVAAPVSNVIAPPPFPRIVVDPNPGTVLVQETAGDLDGDGRPDLIVGFANPFTGLAWYRQPHSGVLTDKWDRFIITPVGQAYEDVKVYDVNGDGAKDVIASMDGAVFWYENPAGHGGDPTGTWTVHTIDPNAPGENNFYLVDMDGDGQLDLVTHRKIYFRSGSDFPVSVIYNNAAFRGVALFDIGSGKGAINLVGTDPNDPFAFVWYENPRETGGNARTAQWISHFIGASYPCSDPPSCFGGGSVANMASGDINGDGRMDVVTVQSEGYPIVPPGGIIWWETPLDRRSTWIKHTIDPVFPSPHNVWVADIDKNGTMDIITAEQEQSPERRVSIFFNDGSGNLSLQILSNIGSHNPFLIDLNGDGWLDLFSAGHGRFGAPNPVELYINPRGGFVLP